MIVYLARNKVNGKCYVGQTSRSLLVRAKEHSRHARRSDRSRGVFHKALLLHGAEAFEWEVLGRSRDRDRLDALERAWIDFLGSRVPDGYNLETGGNRNKRHSPESKARIAQAATGVEFSAARRARISASKTGQRYAPRTAEHRAAISAAKTGKKIKRAPAASYQAGGLARSGERNCRAKLTDTQVEEIRRLARSGIKTRELVVRFGVNKSTVNRIKNNKARCRK